MKFSHLILSTEYSMVYGSLKLADLFKANLLSGMNAIAITDANNMFGAIKLSQMAQKERMKAIYGARILVFGDNRKIYPLHLLAKTPTGYKSMSQMLGMGFVNAKKHNDGLPIYEFSDLRMLKDVFCFNGGMYGELGYTILYDPDNIDKILLKYLDVFNDNFIIDIHRFLQEPREDTYIKRIIYLAAKYGLTVVATGHTCFLNRKDYVSHTIKSCIHTKQTLFGQMRRQFSPEQYFHTKDQMVSLFNDYPEALLNTEYIVQNCNVLISADKLPIFPKYDKTITKQATEDMFRTIAWEGFERKLVHIQNAELKAIYVERFKKEIQILKIKGYIDYFLMVLDFIKWAHEQNIPVGPGRGSGAGSLIAFCLNITDIDPVEHDLLFERFLNFERNSFPDFDLDFCVEHREAVIKYVKNRYGADNVAQIISYSTLSSKAVTKDVCRVLGIGFKESNALTHLMEGKFGTPLQTYIDLSAKLKKLIDDDYSIKELFDHCLALEGLVRGATRHAAGVIIAHCNIRGMGTHCGDNDEDHIVIQWDKDDLENLGFLKFDFLGLRTLTMMDLAKKQIMKEMSLDVGFNHLEKLNNQKVFDLISTGRTNGVFQLESKGMQKFLRQIKLQNFNDIVSIISLFRPGPMNSGMLSSYVDIKSKGKKPLQLHPNLEKCLEETSGLIIYQEQIMKTAQALCGFTLGQGDSLQRAISKKKLGAVQSYRKAFLTGANKFKVDSEIANNIFNIIEEFAKYGFNKSHASAYALITYRSAYLKAYHPTIFYCSHLSVDIADSSKILKYMISAQEDDIKILGPCVNNSYLKFTYITNNYMRYGLTCIKGIGHAHAEQILKAREGNYFKNFEDFIMKVFKDKRGLKLVQTLIYSGALDCFLFSRSYLLAALDYKFTEAKYLYNQITPRPNGTAFKGKSPAKTNFILWENYEPINRLQLHKEEQRKLGLVCSMDVLRLLGNWLSVLKCSPLIDKQGDFRTGYYKYAGSILDIISFKENYIYIVQNGKTTCEVRTYKNNASEMVEIGDIVIINARKNAMLNRYSEVLTIYANSIVRIDKEINNIIIKKIIRCSKENLEIFSCGLNKCLLAMACMETGANSIFQLEIRNNISSGHKIIFQLCINANAYFIHTQLSELCTFAYIFKN